MRLYRPVTRGRPSPTWWLSATEGGVRIRESLGTADRAVAEARAAARLTAIRREQISEALGVETHAHTRSADLADLLADFARELDRRGVTDHWRRVRLYRCSRLIEAMGAAGLGEITSERIALALPLVASHPRTQGFFCQALGSLFRWLCAAGRWDRNPALAVRLPRVVEGARRRALRPAELDALLCSAPPHRALVYLVAGTTGLRRSELDTLRWADLNLEAARLEIRARRTKSRRGATLPLIERTVTALEEHRADPWACAGSSVRGMHRAQWRERIEEGLVLPPTPSVRTLRRDLERAGVTWGEDDRMDLHCLRVTYITSLLRAGVGLAQVQRLARHADARTTAGHYARLDTADDRAAAAALERLLDTPLDSRGEEGRGNKGLKRQAGT